MKVAMIIRDGFEDVEAIAPYDILIRAGVEVDLIGPTNVMNPIKTGRGLNLKLDKSWNAFYHHYEEYDAIIIPGGNKGVSNILKEDNLDNILHYFNDNNKLIASICAGPTILAKAGILKNRRFTCYKGFEVGIDGIYTGAEIELDGNILTARSMLYSIQFGLKIVEILLGKEASGKIYTQIEGLTKKS